MPSNLKSLTLLTGQWVDVYSETGIEVGTKIAIQNVGASDVRLTTALLQPDNDSDSYQVIQVNDFPMANDFGDPGAWAFSGNQEGKIQVWAMP